MTARPAADFDILTQMMIIATGRTKCVSVCECGRRMWPEL